MTPPHLYYSSWGRRSGYTIDEDHVSMEFSFDTVHDSKRDSVLDENEILLRSFFYFPETKTFQIGNRNRAFRGKRFDLSIDSFLRERDCS